MDSHLEMDFEDRVSGYHPLHGYPLDEDEEPIEDVPCYCDEPACERCSLG